jgi:DNA-directed RNA polymerase subunit M/transcription elongation factor TFIIS
MIFCPICANLLVISIATGDQMWACQACTYRFPITKQVRPPLLHSTPKSACCVARRPSR